MHSCTESDTEGIDGGIREKTEGWEKEEKSRKQIESERQKTEVLHGTLVSQHSKIKEGWRRRRHDEGAREIKKKGIRHEGMETVKENV